MAFVLGKGYIEIEERLQARAVPFDEVLEPRLKMAVNWLWIFSGADRKEPETEVEVILAAVVGFLEMKNHHGVWSGEIPRSGLLPATQCRGEFVKGRLNDVSRTHRS